MGLLKSLAGIAAPIAGTILGGPIGGAIGGALGGAISGSNQPKSTTTTTQQQLDPRIESILFGGSNGNGPTQGLLSQYQALLNQPQSQASQNWANTNANYLNQNGAGDLNQIRNTAQGLMQGNQAPQVTAAPQGASLAGPAQANMSSYAVGNMVDAPSQNNINLTPTFQNLLAGGDTTKLMNSLQAGNALAGAQFKQNQQDLTDNLQRNILPGIRGGAIAGGQYGSSRQGIAEGLAASDLTKQLNNSNTQFGLGATAANSSALANAYENGQNRALSAAQGLSGQQYATAFQNANTKNQAEFMNVGNEFDLNKFNAGLQQQSNLANQQAGQQQGLANQALAQQAQQSNQAAWLQNNAQNNSAASAGAGLLSGLLGQAGNNVNAQDMYGITKAQGVNGLLAPYLAGQQSGSRSVNEPVYQNQGNNILGGLLGGAQLGGLFGGGSGGGSSLGQLMNYQGGAQNYTPSTSMSIPSLPNFGF
jgi:hypothetical protein